MPRPKIYTDPAQRQRAFRLRQKVRDAGAEALFYARLEKMHRTVERAAADGDERAALFLGKTPSDTAMRLIFHTQRESSRDDEDLLDWERYGFDIAYYAYEEAASTVILEKANVKAGVFQVVIGTEPRKRKVRNSQADRPAAASSAKRKATTKSSTHRTKKPLKGSPAPA